MHRIVKARPLENCRIALTFADGVHGIVDLSHLRGRGVFAAWNDPAAFKQVRIGENGELIWSNQVDLCPDSLYLPVTGKRPADVFAGLRRELVHA